MESDTRLDRVNDVIAVRGLVKSFGRTRALNGLDLRVSAGEIHGFLGPNGAGKSTTMRVLLGLIRADGGSVAVFGDDPWSAASKIHSRLAYVPGDITLWPNLTGGEIIDLLMRMQGSPDAGRRADLIDRFELDPSRKARAYSRGNRQKVVLIAALACHSELLVLDEPASGLDPLMEASFREVLKARRDEGQAVLLSSHILAEVEAVCDRVTIIREGRTIDSGSLIELRHLASTSITAEVASIPVGLDLLAGVANLEIDGLTVRCQVEQVALEEVVRRLAEAGVSSLACAPPTLEELFLRHYGAGSLDQGKAAGGHEDAQ